MSKYLPNLMIIGAYKCGTSYLYDRLNLHPAVTMSTRKEPAFFSEAWNWHKGVQWYQSLWLSHNTIMGESSPQYTYASDWETVPERMKSLMPQTKLIISIRDPIARIVSHYLHSYKKFDEEKNFEDAVSYPTLDDSFYVQCSRYHKILAKYLETFDRSQIHIVVLEELQNSPAEQMKKIFQFLDIDDSFYSDSFMRPANQTRNQMRKTAIGLHAERIRSKIHLSKIPAPLRLKTLFHSSIARRPLVRPTVEEEFRNRLVEILEPDVRHLREQFDIDLDRWTI